MKTKRVRRMTEITMETTEYIFARKSAQTIRVWCESCGAIMEMVRPEEAARRADVSTRTIYRWVEAGNIHFQEAQALGSLICLRSLSRAQHDRTRGKVTE